MSHHWAQKAIPGHDEKRATTIRDGYKQCPIVIAIPDSDWCRLTGDAFDNEDIYYEHHVSSVNDGPPGEEHEESEACNGFVPRGHHYALVWVTSTGGVGIDWGMHRNEVPDHAVVMGG